MPVPGERQSVVGDRLVAFLDHVWLHARVLWAQHRIAPPCHKKAVETHC